MRDPHVEKLLFVVSSGPGIAYSNVERMAFENSIGRFVIEDTLCVSLVDHFDDEETARAVVDPFLRAGEMSADLERNLGQIRFKFSRAKVVDRNPPGPGEPQIIRLKGVASLEMVGQATALLTCHQYPKPPAVFRVSPEAEIAYQRWVQYQQGREPLQSMAYFVLTLLEWMAGSRREVVSKFATAWPVVDALGRLSSTKGDTATARKAGAIQAFNDLTGPEKAWLEQAVRRIVLRVGERASGVSLDTIEMSELPRL